MRIVGIGLYLLVVMTATTKAQNKITLDSTVRFDYINGVGVPAIKNIFFYNESGQLLEEIEQNWSLINIRWENVSRQIMHYFNDMPDTITNWIYEAEAWRPTSRIVNTYENRKLSEVRSQIWNNSLGLWQNNALTLYGMAGEKNSYVSRMQWDSASMLWHPVDSVLTVRDSFGLPECDTTYAWLDLANTYLLASLTKHHFDTAGQLILRIRYKYDFDDLKFAPRSRDTFAYDENGFQVLSQFDAWLQPLQIWEPSFRIERIPNSDGHLFQSSLFFYDFISQQLRPSSRLEYTYTDGTARAESDSLIYSVENFVYQGPFEVPDYLRRYFYSEQHSTAVKTFPVEPVVIYPNPALEYVFIKGSNNYSEYHWLDATGRILTRGIIQQEKMIPLPRGIQGPLILQLLSPQRKFIQNVRILSH